MFQFGRLPQLLDLQVGYFSPSLKGLVSGIFWGRHLGRCISQFLAVGRGNFLAKMDIFRNFRDISTMTNPKSLFIAFLLTNFHIISKKSAQKFFTAPSAPRKKTFFPISPQQMDPPGELSPPPNIPDQFMSTWAY